MNATTSTINWAIDSRAEVLADIHQENINIAIYNRSIAHLQDEIRDLVDAKVEFRMNGEPESIISSLESKFELYKSMVDDVSNLLRIFQEITKANLFKLLLTTVSDNMCRKFHTDINDLRLLCTYSGPGTLWLTDDNIDWQALNSAGKNDSIVLDESKIQQAKTGVAVILKGAVYPKEGTNAVIHRSPTIEETGEKRLLLRIDTNASQNL